METTTFNYLGVYKDISTSGKLGGARDGSYKRIVGFLFRV